MALIYRQWNLKFLGMGLLIGCEADDPKRLFVDGLGYGWRLTTGRALVQPDPEFRGPSTETLMLTYDPPLDVLILDSMSAIHEKAQEED